MSRRPSGSQSMQNGNEGTRTMTSLSPSRSTATTSCVPQSENQRRSSCQRGDSPNAMPVIRICGSGTYVLSSGTMISIVVEYSIPKHLVGDAAASNVAGGCGHGAGQVADGESGHVAAIV